MEDEEYEDILMPSEPEPEPEPEEPEFEVLDTPSSLERHELKTLGVVSHPTGSQLPAEFEGFELVSEADVFRVPSQPKEPEILKQPEIEVRSVDMHESMQQDAIALALRALGKFKLEYEMARFMKKEFDEKYHITWHCVVGRGFGSYVTHEAGHFICFCVGRMYFLLFKA